MVDIFPIVLLRIAVVREFQPGHNTIRASFHFFTAIRKYYFVGRKLKKKKCPLKTLLECEFTIRQ